MNLKVNDTVILKSSCEIPDTPSAPRFGGRCGMVYGTVMKVLTGEHDSNLHRALVKWSNGHSWNFKERDLALVGSSNPPMVDPTEGVYVFLRSTPGVEGLRMGMVSEDFEPGIPAEKSAWVCIQTMSTVPTSYTEADVLSQLSTHLPIASTHSTRLEAINHVLSTNRFPLVTASEVEKVPLFRSLQEARQSEGSCRDRGYLIFTLPSE